MNYKRFFTFALIFMIPQYISCTISSHAYLEAVRKIIKRRNNLTAFNNYMINLCGFFIYYWVLPVVFYSIYYKYDKSIYVCTFFGFFIWSIWDAFPIMLLKDGHKHATPFIYDAFITGAFCVTLSCYLYKHYYNILSKNVYILSILYVIAFLVFFYEGFIFDREGAENNWLVKLGDSINLHKILPYVRINL